MSSIPSNLARVPNLLVSQILRENLTRTNVDLLNTQGQLSSGKRINRPSDDPIGASLVSVIDARLKGGEQRLRNFEHASSTLATIDQLLGNATELALEAKTLASDQAGAGADSATRKAQAVVVESLIQELFSLGNSQFADLYLFGGERTGAAPLERFYDGFRYTGHGDGLLTDLGPSLSTPITIGADRAFGSLSARVEGDVDLNPSLTRQTQLADVRGDRGTGVALGQIEVRIDDGTPPATTIAVDLSGARTVGDALDTIESAIREADPAALGGAFPGGVDIGAGGQRLEVNAAAGYQFTFTDAGGGTTAADLGLSGFTFDNANIENPGADLDPGLSKFTTFGSLGPTPAFAPGDIVFRSGGRVGTVTVDANTTIADFQRDVERLGLGIRAEISADGRGLNIINEVSGSHLSVEESGGGTLTATSLGIRSFAGGTLLSDFNHGRGVQIADGVINPQTGLPDTARNVDFEVTLTNGSTFTVDLRASDIANVDTLIARINSEAAAAGLTIGTGPGEFQATLGDGANGIVFQDNLGGVGSVSVRSLNGHAAEDLGLLKGGFTPGAPATFAGQDRATVRVDSLFSALIDLKSALEANDQAGITFAGERIEADIERLASARAVVGGRASRVEAAERREEDSILLDESVKSAIEDLDYVEATTRFSFLQLIQQAGYTSAAQSQSLTLLNFLR